ncbi:MAG: MFS transporter [Candidatus Microthrix sp.]|nr:MFS transporter [Candidatus Microthrix sp.]
MSAPPPEQYRSRRAHRAARRVETDAEFDPMVGHPHRRRVLWVANQSLVLVVVAVSSLNVAIPSLIRDLNPSPSALLWIVDIYPLVFAGFLLPAGALGDRFGRRRALLFGLVVFGAATPGCVPRRHSGAADRLPRHHGLRCRLRHAIHPLGDHLGVPAARAGQGDRLLGRVCRRRRCVGPVAVRGGVAGLLLARGVPDQLSDRCGCGGCGGAGRARESGPARPPAGSGRRRSVDADVGPVAVRHHRGPGTRLGQPAGGWHPGRRRGGRNPVRALRAACGAPDVGPQSLPDPGVLGIGADDHGGLLRHVWHVLHPVAVLPVRARLLAPAGGHRPAAVRDRHRSFCRREARQRWLGSGCARPCLSAWCRWWRVCWCSPRSARQPPTWWRWWPWC